MGKKSIEAKTVAKTVAATSASALGGAKHANPPTPVAAVPTGSLATQPQTPVELKFAENSSFWAMSNEEQQRLLSYLNVYRKELARLLSEGEAGRFAVIKGDAVAHVWDTADDAMQAGTLLIGPGQFAVYQIKLQDVDRLALGEEVKRSPCPQ